MDDGKKPGYVNADSDQRVVNNVMRHEYRVLTDFEKQQMQRIKDLGLRLYEEISALRMVPTREMSIARTKAEEAVMWAVKHITGSEVISDEEAKMRELVEKAYSRATDDIIRGPLQETDPGSVPEPELPDDPWIHRSAGMRCRTCMWFVEKDGITGDEVRGQIGRCRKHAPTMGGYPVVFKSDWCGDHKLDEAKL